MTAKVSETLLAELSDFVGSRLGLHFPRERWNDLERGARRVSLRHPRPEPNGLVRHR